MQSSQAFAPMLFQLIPLLLIYLSLLHLLIVHTEEQQSIAQSWPRAILEAANGLHGSSKEQGLACRNLKKLLRDFADLHVRDG